MAQTSDLAPTRRKPSTTLNGATRQSRSRKTDKADNLEAQIQQLQSDLRQIGETITRMSNEKLNEARGAATEGAKSIVSTGKHAVDEATDQVNALERQIKTMIRDKPLTAIGGALGIGFILALMSRV